MTTSKHYAEERKERQQLIETIGTGKVIYSKVVFDEKRQRRFLYKITDNAVLMVCTVDGSKLITQMIARPSRINKYWSNAPKWLIRKSVKYTRLGYYI